MLLSIVMSSLNVQSCTFCCMFLRLVWWHLKNTFRRKPSALIVSISSDWHFSWHLQVHHDYIITRPNRGGKDSRSTINFAPILEQILMLCHKIRCFAEKMNHFYGIWPSYLAIENLDSTIENVIFKSVRHPMIWGVFPEVLMALAQNNWEILFLSDRLGE